MHYALTHFHISIYDRLFAMGYTEDQFPSHSWDSEWESLVYQPRELTDRSKSLLLRRYRMLTVRA